MTTLNTMVKRVSGLQGTSDLSAARVRALLSYDPQTGMFAWRVKRGPRPAGSAAGTRRPDGYVQIGIDGKHYLAHRVAVLYMTGAWPSEEVDHEHWDRADNRWSELRPASRKANGQNVSPRKQPGKVTPLRGVEQRGSRYRSRVESDGRMTSLGTFATADEASAVYRDAKKPLINGEVA